MTIMGGDRRSNLALCLNAARSFQLSAEQAAEIIERQVSVIREQLPRFCAEAGLTPMERDVLGSVTLHPPTFSGRPASS